MAQYLIATLRISVVIGVTLQLEQEQIGEQVVAVPGVFDIRTLVTAIVQLAAVQAVVFNVVDHFQQAEGKEALGSKEKHPHPAP